MFVDAAHFVFSSFICHVWSFVRVFLPSSSGRQRYNVLGALNAVSLKLTTYTNDKYINAKSVCYLMKKIYLEYSIYNKPITLILDNAKYQKCKLVRRYAKILKIELLFLPPYSPQLNLIERFWKFVKRKFLYGNYFSNFEELVKGIDLGIESSYVKYQEELKSLLKWNFQSFKNVKISL